MNETTRPYVAGRRKYEPMEGREDEDAAVPRAACDELWAEEAARAGVVNETAAFRVRSIHPNPFRDIERYPILPKKVEALRESLRTTGWWGNVVARHRDDGTVEIAYGHHRLEALRQEFGPNKRVQLIMRDLDDDAMLKVMVRENSEEWGASAVVEQESVRAVVLAYAEAKIELEEPAARTPKATIRDAPSFIPGADVRDGHPEHPYTSTTVAAYLGWSAEKAKHALSALELIERGVVTPEDFDGLGPAQARGLVTEARRIVDGRIEWARRCPESAQIHADNAAAILRTPWREIKTALCDNTAGAGSLGEHFAVVRAAKRIPRGLLRHARKKHDPDKARAKGERDRRKQINEALRHFGEDGYWFMAGMKELQDALTHTGTKTGSKKGVRAADYEKALKMTERVRDQLNTMEADLRRGCESRTS